MSSHHPTKKAAAAPSNPIIAAKTSNPNLNTAANPSANLEINPKSSSNPNLNTATQTSNPNLNTAANPSGNLEINTNPSHDPIQWAKWVDKAKAHKWVQWSFKPYPPEAIIPNTPYLFCKIHDDLANVTPVDSVYGQTPCKLLEGRRFNLKLDRGYLIHSKRQLDYKKDTVRKISNSTATWKNTGAWKMVVGKDGEAVGMSTNLLYMYKGKRGQPRPPPGMWSAVEYVSINNLDGASSVVVLTCKNQSWIDFESAVEAAEHNLAQSYQSLMHAQHDKKNASTILNLKGSVRDNLAILGSRIEQLEVGRRKLKELEDMHSQVVVAENAQSLQQLNEQVGDVQTTDLQVVDAAAPANFGSRNVEVLGNIEVTSSSSCVIERDCAGPSGYFSVLSNKKEEKEKRKAAAAKEKAEKEKAEKVKAAKEKAEKVKAAKEKAEKEKADKDGKKNMVA